MISAAIKLAGFGVGYCYPTYSALKLLDRKVIGPEDVTLWLTYFICAFSLVIGESIGLVSWCVDDRHMLAPRASAMRARVPSRDGRRKITRILDRGAGARRRFRVDQ